MADASITARIGGDASGLVAALEQGKQAAGKFANDFSNIVEKKLGFKDLFRGVLQGIGIASVQQIAEKLRHIRGAAVLSHRNWQGIRLAAAQEGQHARNQREEPQDDIEHGALQNESDVCIITSVHT